MCVILNGIALILIFTNATSAKTPIYIAYYKGNCFIHKAYNYTDSITENMILKYTIDKNSNKIAYESKNATSGYINLLFVPTRSKTVFFVNSLFGFYKGSVVFTDTNYKKFTIYLSNAKTKMKHTTTISLNTIKLNGLTIVTDSSSNLVYKNVFALKACSDTELIGQDHN
ncbi:MAG: hypothetical protein JNJ41_02310 [Bacteroidia bacterium]|nr:hypothetical protein [Bacteroidia bacterium]